MNNFSGFGEAARLYAQNADIIQAMAGKMRDDISAFIDELRRTLQLRLAPIKLHAKHSVSGGIDWFYFIPSTWDHPGLWFHRWSPRLIEPGEMAFSVYRPSHMKEFDDGPVVAIKESESLPNVNWHPPEDTAILHGKILYGGSNPVEACAPAFEILLRRMDAAYVGNG